MRHHRHFSSRKYVFSFLLFTKWCLGLHLPVGHFVLMEATPPRLENLIYFSALLLSLFQAESSLIPGRLRLRAASPSCRQYVGIAFSASSDLRDFFSFCLFAPFLWSGGIEKSVLNNGINGFKKGAEVENRVLIQVLVNSQDTISGSRLILCQPRTLLPAVDLSLHRLFFFQYLTWNILFPGY